MKKIQKPVNVKEIKTIAGSCGCGCSHGAGGGGGQG